MLWFGKKTTAQSGTQRASEFWNGSRFWEAFGFHLCFELGWLGAQLQSAFWKPLVYRGRLLFPRGIPAGQAHMIVSACMAGSLAAVLSAAQGTQLLLSLPDPHPAEMCAQTAWPLQGVDRLSQQACLPLFCG